MEQQHIVMSKECGEEEEVVLMRQMLPQVSNWYGRKLYQYQSNWCNSAVLPTLISFQKHFQALDSDVVVATAPKSGTTWLKALTFSIINRARYSPNANTHPLLSTNPHVLVPFLEIHLHTNNPIHHLIPSATRIFGTHVLFHSLPPSLQHSSDSRIVYLCRNPLDQFISSHLFFQKSSGQKVDLDEAFDMFCGGISWMGSFWDNVLGYWKASIERPDKVLFLKFEDLKQDTVLYTKKVAEFLGCPFSAEEEAQGVIESIVKLCSFNNMKNLEVNKTAGMVGNFRCDYTNFFRKGETGDWVNYLTPAMAQRLDKIMEDKFHGTGLTFKASSTFV